MRHQLGGRRRDFSDPEVAGDDFVTESRHDFADRGVSVRFAVGDEDAQVLRSLIHRDEKR